MYNSQMKVKDTVSGIREGKGKDNWLRASVLGANDGIVSIAGLVLGVAGATTNSSVIFLTGIAGIVAGAISMAAGEYVSVSSSRDFAKAILEHEKWELENNPKEELEELAQIYMSKGISEKTARKAAEEVSANNAFAAHAHMELNLDPDNLTDPWHAAIASAVSFFLGALIPLFAIALPPQEIKVPVAFISVIVALAFTGTLSAHVGGANKVKATARVVFGGALAMVVTYIIGRAFSVSGI